MTLLRLILILSSLSQCYAQLTPKMKEQIMAVHNDMRSKCARGVLAGRNGEQIGPAANMWHMRFNENLAKLAQAYTNTFPTAHKLKYTTKQQSDNYYYYASPKKIDPTKAILEGLAIWSGQVTQNSWDGNVLTQTHLARKMADSVRMLWAETGSVGCGLTQRSRPGKSNELFFVCFYGNAMDVGKEIYKKGPTCSACAKGAKCEKSTGLCKGNWR